MSIFSKKWSFFTNFGVFFLTKLTEMLKTPLTQSIRAPNFAQKIFTRRLVYAVLSGRKNSNPLLNRGRANNFFKSQSAMLRGLASNVDFFEKMVIFHEFWRFFLTKLTEMLKTPLKQSIRAPNCAQKNLHRRISLCRFKLP